MAENTQENFDDILNSIKSDFQKELEALSKINSQALQEQAQEAEQQLEIIDGSSNKANGGSGYSIRR